MKNWQTLDADRVKLMNKHYTQGRAGKKINKIIIHYNAGNLSIDKIWHVWQTRPASAHYQVTGDGTIGQLVWDSDTAWHAGDLDANQTSIGIEHANQPDGTITAAALENGAHLTAAICAKFALGTPTWGVNVFPHQYFKPTSCPGALASTQKDEYMARAGYWYDQMTGQGTPAPSVPVSHAPIAKDIDALAREVITGAWGNGSDRQNRIAAAGYDYGAVQARVNQILGATPAPAFDIEQAARDVLAGKYGNGAARKAALGANYAAVQARVNQLLS